MQFPILCEGWSECGRGHLQQAPLSSRASQLLQAARREPNQHSHGNSHSEQPFVEVGALLPLAFPGNAPV